MYLSGIWTKRSWAIKIVLGIFLILGSAVRAGIVSPRQGGSLPEGYLLHIKDQKSSFAPRHGWIEKRKRLSEAGSGLRPIRSLVGSSLSNTDRALSGRLSLPVVMGLYGDVAEPPVVPEEIRRLFFTGPWNPGTLREYYLDVSFGLLEVTGEVFDWVPLSHNEDYYTGGIFMGLDLEFSKTGELIKEVLDDLDPSVDFGAYDNDGPDGVANSGDDDGFVDVLVVVHPTLGAECYNTPHMWSHSYFYSAWPVAEGSPYRTGDPAAAGDVILIDDYIIGPAISCDEGLIEIGVYCHELGHTLGLPDLYDYDGGSSGIGYWGLMGSGNWNTPSSPAHLCAWSREQLGWVEPVQVDWRVQALKLKPIGFSGEVLKMALPTKRFGRRRYAIYEAAHALVCGYEESEASERGWPGGEGYGNGWRESMIHEFQSDFSSPCTLIYGVTVDVEEGYDFGKLLLETAASVETLAVYTGQLAKSDTIILSDHLPLGPCDFLLRFFFVSDYNYSDEDGGYDSAGGWAFNIDNVRINGGGIEYFTDFESDAGGWRCDSEPAEYFIVENRRRSGFDSKLPGEGLLVWHAENSIAYSKMGNSGGYSNTRARGVVLEEADGLYNLLSSPYGGGNPGDGADPFPGTSGNTYFGPSTVPNSRSNGGAISPVMISSIDAGSTKISAVFRAGMPAPVVTSVKPDSIDKWSDSLVVFDIEGESFQYGATCRLSNGGVISCMASEVSWMGETRLLAAFTVDELLSGRWDLTVVSGDGQEASAGEVDVLSAYLGAGVETGRSFLLVKWKMDTGTSPLSYSIYRSAGGAGFELLIPETPASPTGEFEYMDTSVEPETDYSYMIVTSFGGGAKEALTMKGPYGIEDFPFIADQNYPNPFNGRTTISFFVPSRRTVSIDIFDVSGRRVDSLGKREYGRGEWKVPWEPGDRISSGLYFCVIRTAGVKRAIKMVYLR